MRFCFSDIVVSQDGNRLGTVDSVEVALWNNEVLGIVIGKSDELVWPIFNSQWLKAAPVYHGYGQTATRYMTRYMTRYTTRHMGNAPRLRISGIPFDT